MTNRYIKAGLLAFFLILFTTYSFAFQAGDVAIHGFVSQGFLQSNENNYLADSDGGTFQFNEMGINFGTNLAQGLRVGMQFFARDLGTIGNDNVEIDWAMGEYTWREWAGVRFGLIKSPIGLYTESRDVDNLRTCIILPQGIYDEWNRDSVKSMKGVGLFGKIPLLAAGDAKYQFQYGKIETDTEGGTAQYVMKFTNLPFSKINSIDVDNRFIFNLDWLTPVDGLRAMFTYSHAGAEIDTVLGGTDVTLDNAKADVYIYSIEYIIGDFTFAGEWSRTERENSTFNTADSRYLTLPGIGTIPRIDNEQDLEAWYVSGSYRFNEFFELGMYYSKDDGETNKSGEKNRLEDICATLRFDVNSYWTLKLEGHRMDGLRNVLPSDDGTYERDEWYLFAAKASCMF